MSTTKDSVNNRISAQFQERLENFQKRSTEFKNSSRQYAIIRSVFFVACVVGFVMAANADTEAGLLVTGIFFLAGFAILLKKHQAVKKAQIFNEELARVNQEELDRLTGDYSAFDKGEEFISPEHPYHNDLDIFGKHSVFQLLNRTSTRFGRYLLAKWLSEPADKATILKRQIATKELGPQIDFRQEIQAHGRSAEGEKTETKHLLRWVKEPSTIFKNKIFTVASLLLPVSTTATIVLASFSVIPSGIPLLLVVVNMAVLGSVFTRANDIYKKTISSNKVLKALESQVALIEQSDFESEYLQDLKSRFVHDQIKASEVIKKLQYILDNFHNRLNLMYHIFNILFILDVYWLLQAEKWKENTKADIEAWFAAIGEWECLTSMGGYHFAKPDYTFAEISDTPFTIEGSQVGHPLIKDASRINNTFDFSGKGGICLITGSNMSGKSTFLRTVGVNAVLSLMGAPACAEGFRLSFLKVFTSMRTTDDLEESVSSFYAELKRLRQLLGYIDGETPILFMVDEVLKGTNSEDRHKGAIALIRQLNKLGAFGFVSTHDIGLGNITNELQGVKNYSFNSIIEGDEIIFDYTLTEGICRSFNATKLMQKMGIEIID